MCTDVPGLAMFFNLRMTCLDVFVEGGALHLVMEFMDGDLKKVIEDAVSMQTGS